MVEIFMRPAEFAESEILEAGKKVEAAGKRVTGYAIRRELGGGDQKRLFSVWNSHFSPRRLFTVWCAFQRLHRFR
jgi:hypothetical protein